MKRTKFISLLMGAACVMLMSNFNRAIAQTDGTLTFTFTQSVPTGTSANKNVMAVWIEDNAGTFVKTKMRFWGNGTNDHLPSWVTNCSQNVTDAATGATRTATTTPTAFGAKTITWDGKGAVSGTLMPDGVYKVMIESSYCNPQPANGAHWLLTSYTFTKGPATEHLTPTGDANYSAITSDWVPSFTGIQTNEAKNNISVYPNPTNGIVNIDIKNSLKGTIKVENITGETVFEENVDIKGSKVESIDLSKLSSGNYFVKVQSSDSKVAEDFKIVLGK